MADRKYYVICDANCKFEGMTKEQIFAAIAEATGNTCTDVDSAFITKLKEINKGATVQIWNGTQAEYTAIIASGKKRSDVIYIVTDDTRLDDIEKSIEECKEIAEAAGRNTTVYEFDWNTETNELTIKGGKTVQQLYSDLKNNNPVSVRAISDNNDSMYYAFQLVAKQNDAYTFSFSADGTSLLFIITEDITSNMLVTKTDLAVGFGVEKNWSFREWASGGFELRAVRDVLIKSKLDLFAPSGITQCVAITNVPSFVPEDAVITVTSKNPFIIGANAQINKEDGQLNIVFYARTDEMTNQNIGIDSQIPMSCNIVWDE